MKRIVSLAFAALMLVAFSNAQDSANNSGAESKTELMTVVGCLSKTANTFVITGGAPGAQQFRIIDGDTSALKGKIGQTVKVVGMVGDSDPAQVASPPYNEGSTTGAGYHTIAVQKVKVMGGLCSNAGQEWRGEHK